MNHAYRRLAGIRTVVVLYLLGVVPSEARVFYTDAKATVIVDGHVIEARSGRKTPIEGIPALGRKLGANSTPTWILPNGQTHSGALPIEEVRRLLDQAPPAKR